MTRVFFEGGPWFAWFPVRTQRGEWRWLTTVFRERAIGRTVGPWRYYTN